MSVKGFSHVELRPGAYADSVTLLQVSRAVQDLDGVLAAQVAMATGLNVEVLTEMGFEVPGEATTNDLVVALRLAEREILDEALAGVDRALIDANSTGGRTERGGAAQDHGQCAASRRRRPGSSSRYPGASAFVEAMDALDAGNDVMVFSDNVPLEQELVLKRTAQDRGLLVMGPDCGTAVVGGLGLGFANTVTPGPVGIVAASGTGCQQLLALLDHAGVGVTSAFGVGGRDLSTEVHGLSTREALRRLDADPEVELVVVVSKPPTPTSPPSFGSTPPRWAPRSSSPARRRTARPHCCGRSSPWDRLGHARTTWPVTTREPAGRAAVVGFADCSSADPAATRRCWSRPSSSGRSGSNTPLAPELALGPDLTAADHTMVDSATTRSPRDGPIR